MKAIFAAVFVLALCACNGTRGNAPQAEVPVVPTLVQQVRDFHRTAPCVTAALLVKVKPEGRDSLTFTINVWTTPDGRIRLEGSKVGFSGFTSLIQPDGNFLVLAGDEACRDDLEVAFARDLGPGAQLARMVEELTLGPVPGAESLTAAGRRLTGSDPATGLAVELDLAADRDEAQRKIWRNADGSERMRVEYTRYKVFDGLQRPSVMRIVLAGHPGDFLVRIQQLDVVPAVSAARMTLEPGAGARALPFADFLKRLGE